MRGSGGPLFMRQLIRPVGVGTLFIFILTLSNTPCISTYISIILSPMQKCLGRSKPDFEVSSDPVFYALTFSIYKSIGSRFWFTLHFLCVLSITIKIYIILNIRWIGAWLNSPNGKGCIIYRPRLWVWFSVNPIIILEHQIIRHVNLNSKKKYSLDCDLNSHIGVYNLT